MLQRNPNYATPPNPKHAITFAIVSVAILILPLFWSPLNDQKFTPLATATPLTVEDVLAKAPTPTPTQSILPDAVALIVPTASASPAAPPADPAQLASAAQRPGRSPGSAANWPTNSSREPKQLAASDRLRLGQFPASRPAALNSPSPQATAPTVNPSETSDGKYHDPTLEFSGQLRRIVLSLLVTTALIAFTLKAAKKHIPALGGKTPGSFMNVLAREAISPTQSLALVKVGSKILLVGLSEQSMTTLSEFAESDLENLMPKAAEPEPRTARAVYGDVLRHYLAILPGMGAKK